MSQRPSIQVRRLFVACLLGLCIVALSACEWSDLINGDDDDDSSGGLGDNTPPATDTNVPGLSVAVSGSDFETTLANVRSAIGDRGDTDIVETVDHQDNADSVGESLRPTTVILFDNPNRSSALIAADPRVALDLPMRVLVYRDRAGATGGTVGGKTTGTGTATGTATGTGTTTDQTPGTANGTATDNTPGTAVDAVANTDTGRAQDNGTNQGAGAPAASASGNVAVAYSNAAYLDARYNLGSAEQGALDGFGQELAGIAADATGDTASAGSAAAVGTGEGIERVTSVDDFSTTVDRLVAAIGNRDKLELLETLDFQSRGASRGLNPSTLLVFGNPSIGTQFMQSSQTAGVDLPQKMLVSADESGNVTIYYNDPAFIADRHGIDNRDDQVKAVADLLAQLASEADGVNSDARGDQTAERVDADGQPAGSGDSGGGDGVMSGTGDSPANTQR